MIVKVIERAGIQRSIDKYRLYNKVKVAMIFIKPRAIGLRFDKCHSNCTSCITNFYHAKPSTGSQCCIVGTSIGKLSQV